MNFLERLIWGWMARRYVPPVEELTFESLESADSILVTNNLNQKIKAIDDPQTIQTVLDFVKEHHSGWTVPFEGVPVARLRLNFLAADVPLGNVGVDETFLTAHQLGTFWSKASDAAEGARLLDIIGVAEYGDT